MRKYFLFVRTVEKRSFSMAERLFSGLIRMTGLLQTKWEEIKEAETET